MAKKQTLTYQTVDEGYMVAAGTTLAISDNNSVYLLKADRKKTFSVMSDKTNKVLFTAKTKKQIREYIEKRTGKKVVFAKPTW